MYRMAKQMFNIILLVDTSKSMHGKRIEQVNQAIKDIERYLKVMQKENSNVDFYISILTFSTDAQWHDNTKATYIDNFNFKEFDRLVTALGCTLEIKIVLPSGKSL